MEPICRWCYNLWCAKGRLWNDIRHGLWSKYMCIKSAVRYMRPGGVTICGVQMGRAVWGMCFWHLSPASETWHSPASSIGTNFYRTRVRSLVMLVTNWLTHSVTFSRLDGCEWCQLPGDVLAVFWVGKWLCNLSTAGKGRQTLDRWSDRDNILFRFCM